MSLSLLLALLWAAAPQPPEKLLFLLEYVAVDYAAAVQDGAVIDAFEYREMQEMTRILLDQLDPSRQRGASQDLHAGLVELADLVRDLRPAADVRSLALSLGERLTSELRIVRLPPRAPDLDRGRGLYLPNCAACHGPTGGGNGPSAPGMSPPASSFREASRMDLISPRQVHGAILFGIDGTAMPSYGGVLAEEDYWDLTFYVMTLREGFDPHPPPRELALSPEDLVQRGNDELLALARVRTADAQAGEIDYYRQNFELLTAGQVSDSLTGTPGSSVAVATALQDVFARVAETATPSLVGVTSFVREAEAARPPEPTGTGAWTEATLDEQLYPGFRRVRSGSGFLVDREGYILTAAHLLTGPDDRAVDAVDIELHDGRHILGRVVGTEPAIDLGVLQLEVFSTLRPPELQPATIGDSEAMRVGHWAIALGNPWGPGTIFAVGPLSSQPGRDCYQADRIATLMQSSLRVPAGGYGGPLLNIAGEVVGLTLPGPGVNPDQPEIARAAEFALPIKLAMNIYQALRVKESRQSPWLGVSVLELAAARRGPAGAPPATKLPRTGVYIDNVYDPSPAHAAGLRVGDSLVSIDGNRLLSVLDFQKWLYLSGIGRTVKLEIFRDGKTFEKRVPVEQRP